MTKPHYTFEVSVEDQAKISRWLVDTVYPAVIKTQKKSGKYKDNFAAQVMWESGCPYGGAIGGDLTYEFTPNSLGYTFVVVDGHTKERLDLTDYDSW